MSKDAKVGFLVLMLAVSVYLLNSLRASGVVSFGNELGLIFSQVHGLRAGDMVTIGGVPSGRVVSIDFAPQEIQEAFLPLTGGVALVRAEVSFDNSRKIPKESTYNVSTDLNGRRWIEITVSPSKEEIGPDDTFFAEESARQDDQMQTTIRTFATLSEQTEALRDVLSDPEFRLRTKDTASNLRFYSRELRAASAEAPAQLKAFEDNLNVQEAAILNQIRGFDDKTKEVRQRMTEMSPQITETLQGWTERMSRQGDRLSSTLQAAIERSEDFEAMIDRALQEQLKPESVQALISQTRKWARKLDEYRMLAEDLHALTSDPTVRADLKAAIAKFEAKSIEVNERLLKLEKQIDSNPLPQILGVPDVQTSPTPGVLDSSPEDSPAREADSSSSAPTPDAVEESSRP